jgi:hypothetical protein
MPTGFYYGYTGNWYALALMFSRCAERWRLDGTPFQRSLLAQCADDASRVGLDLERAPDHTYTLAS